MSALLSTTRTDSRVLSDQVVERNADIGNYNCSGAEVNKMFSSIELGGIVTHTDFGVRAKY